MSENNQTPKKTRKRSTSYPAFNLAEVVDAAKELKEKLGDGPYSREHMATALGYKAVTGSSGMKISSCVHFGLLERNGNTYSQSESSNRLFNYYDEDERMCTLLEAFSKPALYSKLIAEYTGKSLPLMLESILVRNYGIQENAAKAAAANFRESAEFVGALKNGVLNVGGSTGDANDIQAVGDSPIAKTPYGLPKQIGGQQNLPFATNATSQHLSVTLPSGLVVSYTQELAPAFAFGIFGQKLIELDTAISEYKKTLSSSSKDVDHASAEKE